MKISKKLLSRYPAIISEQRCVEELKNKDFYPKYICYLSASKVENLYSQISDIDISTISQQQENEYVGAGEIGSPTIKQFLNVGLSFGRTGRRSYCYEGQKNHIQKLKEIMSYLQKHGLIQDLSSIDTGDIHASKKQPVLYSITAEFTLRRDCKYEYQYIDAARLEDKQYPLLLTNSSGNSTYTYKLIGDVIMIESNLGKYRLILACSTKYFSNMASSLKPNSDEPIPTYEARPDSGNYLFFNRAVPGTFEAFFILNGKKDNCLYGSPLVLFNDYSSRISI